MGPPRLPASDGRRKLSSWRTQEPGAAVSSSPDTSSSASAGACAARVSPFSPLKARASSALSDAASTSFSVSWQSQENVRKLSWSSSVPATAPDRLRMSCAASRMSFQVCVSTFLALLGAFFLSTPERTWAFSPAPPLTFATGPPVRRLQVAGDLPQALEELLNVGGGTSLFIGIFLTLIGSVMMSGGSTMMKVGLHLEAEKSKPSSSLMCEPMWLGGLAAYTFGALLHIVALAFAPASVLAPMNSIGLIANAVTAATVLKEPFGFQEFLFTGGTALGVTLCACATLLPHDQFVNMGGDASSASEEDIGLYSWRDPWYLAYLACCVVPGFGTLIYVNSEESAALEEQERYMMNASPRASLKRLEMARRGASQPSNSASGGGVEGNVGNLGGPPNGAEASSSGSKAKVLRDIHEGGEDAHRALLDSDADSQQGQGKKTVLYSRCIGLCYGFLAGLTGAQCVLELKELAACAHRGMDDPAIWHHPQPYLVMVFLVASVWTQIHFLNLGLARGDATLVVPTYYVSWTFFGTLGGFAKFHEIQGFSVGAIVLFTLGFGLTILCIAILAVQEMTILRRYVDERVPDLAEADLDLPTQELQEQQLAKQVTLAMGLFPFSMLGRTVGRKRFRPLYQRFRRTRSTASDTALNDSYGELTLSSSGLIGAYTLPHNLHFNRTGSEGPAWDTRLRRETGADVPRADSLGPSPFSRHLAAAAAGRQGADRASGASEASPHEGDRLRVHRPWMQDAQPPRGVLGSRGSLQVPGPARGGPSEVELASAVVMSPVAVIGGQGS
ncbi:DUF803 domain-containing protein [Besnoitia besnoiti]|uniref:DUF803 domain-containing protein n=1 Tax=Besnoitia besnoiti TaxID=94643 RepID=A0A2A9M8B2_BESBE|nr:DUF803 domain-containing protein [Besnoitia besnoiti]PFH34225.1 DUF803 domain-containing protein [Besnoitia besnoiti]